MKNINLINDIVNTMNKKDYARFMDAVNQAKLPSTMKITAASIKANLDRFKQLRFKLEASIRVLENTASNKESHFRDVLVSPLYPCNPSINPDVTGDAYFNSIQSLLLVLIDSKLNTEKYTAEELDTINKHVSTASIHVNKILDAVRK